MGPLELTISIIGIVLIIVAAYYTTWFIAKRTAGVQKGRGITVLDRFSLARDKTVCAIEIADTVYLVVLTNQSAVLLDKLPAEDYKAARGEDTMPQMFPGVNLFTKKGKPGGGGSRFSAAMAKALSKEKKVDIGEERSPLEFAAEEDDLDVVFRKMQARRAKKNNSSGDGQDEEI